MPDQWQRFQQTTDRLHNTLGFPTCTFHNYTQTGIEDGQSTGSYNQIGELDCEFVPPGADSTVDTEGTHLDFTTSIRVPTSDLNTLTTAWGSDEWGASGWGTTGLDQYGDDNERPTRVRVEGTTYEVQAMIPEHGSNMTVLRLVEV